MYYAIECPNHIIIATEYCNGGDLFNILYNSDEAFEEARACKIFSQILSALEYLHNQDIAQRDIKLENFLVDEFNDTKLTDFGLSVICEKDELLHDRVGSPYYTAPEIFSSTSQINYDGKKADIWSLGICLYYLVCGDNPFSGETYDEFIYNLVNKELEVPEGVSPLFEDFIRRILVKNPETRLTINQIKEHKWIHIIDFNFMKSLGIIIDKDILPIDINIIKNISEHNKEKIKNLINDILLNKHNDNTIKYYLEVEELERNKKESVSIMKPIFELYLKYKKDEKNKLEFYENDVNKKVDELAKIVLNEIKEDEYRIRQEIKNSLLLVKANSENPKRKIQNNPNKNNNNENKENNNCNNDDNNNIEKNHNENNSDNNNINKVDNAIKPSNEKANKKYRTLRSKSFIFDKYEDFLKKEEEKKKKEELEELLKKNKVNVLNQYISPLLFVHDLVNEIIFKVIQLKTPKEPKRKMIQGNLSSLNIFETKTPLKEFETIKEESNNSNPTTETDKNKNNFKKKNKGKTSSEFYQKNKKNKNSDTQKTGQSEKKIKIKKNNLEKERNYKEMNSSNFSKKNNNPINGLKNNNKKIEKKKMPTRLTKRQNDNFNFNSSIFPKDKKEFKNEIFEKIEIKKKRDASQKQKEKKNNILNVEIFNIIIKDKRRQNSDSIKKKSKKYEEIFEKRKKERSNKKNGKKEKKDKKEKKKNLIKSVNTLGKVDNNIDENLNINEEKTKKRKYTNGDKKNLTKSQDNFYNSKKTFNTTMTNISSEKKRNKGKNISVNENLKSGKKFQNTSNKTSHQYSSSIIINEESKLNKTNNQAHQRMQTTFANIDEKQKRKKEVKNSILNNKSTKEIFTLPGRNKKNNNISGKNLSTNDSSDKNQFDLNENKNRQIKTLQTELSYSCRNIFKKNGFKGHNIINKNDTNVKEIKTKKDESSIKDIITDIIGNNNITIIKTKKHIKFACKKFIENKKLEFNLYSEQKDKNIYIITGELKEGDINSYNQEFSEVKKKLE